MIWDARDTTDYEFEDFDSDARHLVRSAPRQRKHTVNFSRQKRARQIPLGMCARGSRRRSKRIMGRVRLPLSPAARAPQHGSSGREEHLE